MNKKKELIQQYIILFNEEDVNAYQTPNGTDFVREDENTWYNMDNPNEVLTTEQLAERCTREEIEG